jgi:uncharacterized membrane protein YjgN (DUF898 family)
MPDSQQEKNNSKNTLSDLKLNSSDSVENKVSTASETDTEDTVLEGNWPLTFAGKGSELFGIFIENIFLNLLTLGIFYPWAKARQLRYYYSSTHIYDSNFQFSGTGKEMFFGLAKALALLFLLNFAYETLLAGMVLDWMLILSGLLYFLFFWLLIVIASVGARRYRMSRTSWRGIRFRFEGTFKETSVLIAKGWLLTLLSLGLYYPYYRNRFQAYWTSKSSFGNIAFSYDGQSKEVFRIWLWGILLSILTLGIYMFWLKANLQRYFWNHTAYSDSRIISSLYGGKLLKETMIYMLLVIFTFGFGLAWAAVRYKRFYLGTLSLEGKIDLAAIKQSEAKLTGATGEGMADLFDLEM